MSAKRASTSLISRLPRWISVLPVSRIDAAGVMRRKPPLPAAFGKMFPSISQSTLKSRYRVSSGAETITGRRWYMLWSIRSHMLSDSAMCVSASMIPFILVSSSAFEVNLSRIGSLGQTLSGRRQWRSGKRLSFRPKRENDWVEIEMTIGLLVIPSARRRIFLDSPFWRSVAFCIK